MSCEHSTTATSTLSHSVTGSHARLEWQHRCKRTSALCWEAVTARHPACIVAFHSAMLNTQTAGSMVKVVRTLSAPPQMTSQTLAVLCQRWTGHPAVHFPPAASAVSSPGEAHSSSEWILYLAHADTESDRITAMALHTCKESSRMETYKLSPFLLIQLEAERTNVQSCKTRRDAEE